MMPQQMVRRGLLVLAAFGFVAFTYTLGRGTLFTHAPWLILNAVVLYVALAAFVALLLRGTAFEPPVRALCIFLFAVAFMNGFEFLERAYPRATPISTTVTRFNERAVFVVSRGACAALLWTSLLQYMLTLSPAVFANSSRKGLHRLASVRAQLTRPAAPFTIAAVGLIAVLLAERARESIANAVGLTVGLLFVGATVVGGVSVISAARSANPETRRRALLLTAGLQVYLVTLLLTLAAQEVIRAYLDGRPWPSELSVPLDLAVQIGLLALVMSGIAAVFFQGLLDPKLVMRRTTIFGGLTLLGVFTAAAIGNAVQDILAQLFGITGLPATMLLGGLCALAALPFRRLLGKLNDGTMRWLLADPQHGRERAELN